VRKRQCLGVDGMRGYCGGALIAARLAWRARRTAAGN
jgi:hypothetical protein